MSQSTASLRALSAQLPFGGAPLDGIITAGQPTAADLQKAQAAGCTTVLDLCAPEEPRGYDEPSTIAATGMTYVNVPVRGYNPDEATFDKVRAVLKESSNRPLLFHCRSANRVGGLLLPYLILDEGKTQQEALAIAGQVGLRSNDLAQAALTYVARKSR